MTKEEAIKMIQDDIRKNHDYLSSQYMKALRMAIEALQADSEWIPCSERLPSERGWYLITVQGMNRFADMDYYYGNSEWSEVSSEQKVIAWMPLPKPYREEKQNG